MASFVWMLSAAFNHRLIRSAPALVGLIGVTSGFVQPRQRVNFSDVEPILKAKCGSCHSATSASGGLALDSYSGALKAVIPTNSKSSVLVRRLLGLDGLPRMPMGFAPLPSSDVDLIRTWIDQGALEGQKKSGHWAFVRPERPKLPAARNLAWVRNPIDSFVLTRLEKERLLPSPEADRATLIRRVSLDLLGLPPTPAEIDAFVADKSPNAYEKVVDRLLANPHYGERMALPWLDAARYADSNGFQQDGDTFQYVWRDWVVKAMNDNMPFDRFTTLQLAGDLLPGISSATEEGRAALIATGFNRNHMLNGEGGAIAEEQRNVNLFDRVDATSTTWMGLTMTCARCHDHKYDPITQKDFYRLMALFNRVPEAGVPSGGGQYRLDKPWIYAGTQRQMSRLAQLEVLVPQSESKAKRLIDAPEVREAEAVWRKNPGTSLPEEITKLLGGPRNAEQEQKLHEYFLEHVLEAPLRELIKQSKSLRIELDGLRDSLPKVMIMSDRAKRDTYLYNRGNYEERLEKVTPATPAFLPPLKGDNRLALAKWITSPENPLTARVQVNRYWQLFFGKGWVDTPENFGKQGSPPTHPELLDWLAVDFREHRWNVKRLHRMIVTSATYRQSSRVTPELLKRDPANRLMARGARFRLPAMLLRDVALSASGLLNEKIGGKPVYPYQPEGIWDGLSITKERDFTYPLSKGEDLYRRSLYTFWRRTAAPGNMFDASSRQICTVRQSQTSTPLHALTTLNDTTWVEAARALAQRVMSSPSANDKERLTQAFRQVCARKPDTQELTILIRSLNRARSEFKNTSDAEAFLSQGAFKAKQSLDKGELAAYASVCLAILNLDEALTRE